MTSYPREAPRWRRYLRLIRPNVPGDVDDELQFHFDSRIEDLVAQGNTLEAARRQAAAEFGDLETARAALISIDRVAAARQRRGDLVRDVGRDVSYAVRSLARTPGVTLSILAMLALGVGANSAIFTLLRTMFTRTPPAVAAPNDVRRVWAEYTFNDGRQFSPVVSYPQFAAATEALGERAFAAVYRLPEATRRDGSDGSSELQASYANGSFFSLLGVRPGLGRLFSREESTLDVAVPVAVISDAYWHRAMLGDSSVLGERLTLNGTKFTIVGVAERNFTGVDLNAADAWIPLSFYAAGRGGALPWWKDSRVNGLFMLLRPRPAVRDAELEQRLTTALRHAAMGSVRPDSSLVVRLGGIVAANGPGRRSREESIAIRLAGVALIVLLIACANVVNLLLARAVERRREIAVRLALGISRARLIRLFLAESAVLAAAAATVAVVIAALGGAVLRSLLLPEVHWGISPLDWSAVAFAVGVATMAAIFAGMVPAVQAGSPVLTDALKAGSGAGGYHHARLRSSLVVLQTALSTVLLVGALLFVKSLVNVRNVNIGFDHRGLLTAGVRFDDPGRGAAATSVARLGDLAARIRQLPGVQRAALASMEPMAGFSVAPYYTETDSLNSRAHWMPTVTTVNAGYFATTGIRLVRGSDFTRTVLAATPRAVVVNAEMARGLWPGRDAIGKCIHFVTRLTPCTTVVGVVADGRMGQVIEDPWPMYYVPINATPDSAHFPGARVVIVRVAPDRVAEVAAQIRASVGKEFPAGVPFVKSLDERLEPQYRPWRLGAVLFTLFGGLALMVAVMGIYSSVSYGVTQRTHELGVRSALGAGGRDLLLLIVGDGLGAVAVGAGVGIVLALAGGRLVASQLYGVRPNEPVSLGLVVSLLLATGGIATMIPARRAVRADPVRALRAE